MSFVGLTDEDAVARIQTGDGAALEVLYDRYGGQVFALVRRIVRDPSLAEEIVQETFWRVWTQSDRFEPGKGRFGTWVLSIAHHLAIDSIRRLARRPRVLEEALAGDSLAEAPDDADIAESAWVKERRVIILAALETLPEVQRQAIELAYYGGLTQQEIANLQSAPISTVKTRLALGLKKLADALQARGVALEDALS